MPLRLTPLVSGEYYHIYNRGVARQPTYSRKKDYERFLLSLSYYRFDTLPFKLSKLLQLPIELRHQTLSTIEAENNQRITLVSYALMPNHFHLLLRQNTDKGISTYIKQVIDSYTRYFNTKYKRVGTIYQGPFKAVRIETDEQLVHVSRYIHLNPLVSYIVSEKDFPTYPWSSMQDFVNNNSSLVAINHILEHFASPLEYIRFIYDQADYGKELERIKHLTLEE